MADPDAETAAAPAVPTEPLAWSQETEDLNDLEPYTDDLYGANAKDAPTEDAPKPTGWGRLPLIAFVVAAMAALLAVGFAAVGLTSESHSGRSQPSTHPSASPPAPQSSQPPPPPPPAPSTAVAPPPAPEPTAIQTHSRPRPTTAAPAPPPPPATTPPPPPATTPPPPTTTEAPPPPPTESTPPSPPMTTAYIRVPFVPVPIPIQVPANPNQPPAYQQPQYPYGPGPYQRYPGY